MNQAHICRYTLAERGRTFGNMYNYAYWKCSACKYHPGSSDGPPTEYCFNCKGDLYTANPQEAIHKIEIYTTDCGLGFRII